MNYFNYPFVGENFTLASRWLGLKIHLDCSERIRKAEKMVSAETIGTIFIKVFKLVRFSSILWKQ